MAINIFRLLIPILHAVMKIIAKVTPKKIEIEPGTKINFWVPIKKSHGKPNIVFVHGFFANGILTWFFQVLSLSSKYNIYVPDLIFFGDSITDDPDGRSTTFQAQCLAKGLMKLGVEKCIYVGISYGGMVGFKLAKLYPNLVETLVASDTVMEMTESITNASLRRIGYSTWSEYLLPETAAGLRTLLQISSYNKVFTWIPDFIYKQFLEVMFENRKERDELLKALVVPNNELSPADYSQKVYLLWGKEDRIFNLEYVDQLRRELGDKATLRIIENAGHTSELDRPSKYNHHLKEILASV